MRDNTEGKEETAEGGRIDIDGGVSVCFVQTFR